MSLICSESVVSFRSRVRTGCATACPNPVEIVPWTDRKNEFAAKSFFTRKTFKHNSKNQNNSFFTRKKLQTQPFCVHIKANKIFLKKTHGEVLNDFSSWHENCHKNKLNSSHAERSGMIVTYQRFCCYGNHTTRLRNCTSPGAGKSHSLSLRHRCWWSTATRSNSGLTRRWWKRLGRMWEWKHARTPTDQPAPIRKWKPREIK